VDNSVVSSENPITVSGKPSICEACGVEFGCGAALPGCWCTGIALTDEALAELKESYKMCLCPACLGKVTDVGFIAQAENR
jgi:hypothetical protein